MRIAALKWLSLFLLIGLCGCAGRALRHSYSDFSEVYADSMNRQLLLNLARLAHSEPPYFIQLGQINSQFTFNTSFGFTPSLGLLKNPAGAAEKLVQETLTFGGNATAGAVQTPTFQFVPLNGEAFSSAIIAPISDKMFYTLYDQGFSADILVRTMVASVTVPDQSNPGKKIYLSNHPYSDSYPDFLRFCGALRKAQLQHQIVVKSVFPSEPTTFKDVELKDAVAASSAGFTVTNKQGSNEYFVLSTRKSFRLENVTNVTNHPEKFSVSQTKYLSEDIKNVEFQMRTFIATMYAVAREETYIEKLANGNKQNPGMKFTKESIGAVASFEEADGEPAFKVRPILILTGFSEEERSRLFKLVELRHRNKVYTIGDTEDEKAYMELNPTGPPPTSNRSVFSLISYLFAQIAIDPQKLPVQQLIQVR